MAQAPARLAGLIEIRGLGIMRLAHVAAGGVALMVRLVPHDQTVRMPLPERDATLDVPVIEMNPFQVSAAQRVALALDCAEGSRRQHAGAFAL